MGNASWGGRIAVVVMIIRAAWPSGDKNSFRPRLNSLLSNTSGGGRRCCRPRFVECLAHRVGILQCLGLLGEQPGLGGVVRFGKVPVGFWVAICSGISASSCGCSALSLSRLAVT